jgi:magnesium chelatase subunit D
VGVRPGLPSDGARLDLLASLRAAAPWQALRRQALHNQADHGGGPGHRVLIRPDDLRVIRYKQRSETATIFLVDASGSAAMERLAEAKGAVELLLADCYIRRDQVAVIAFRGTAADIILPPTRSLARARRSLAGLPGGGGTPLALGLEALLQLAGQVQKAGQRPLLVVLTDGRGNIDREGLPGRDQAKADAMLAARALRHFGAAAILVDTARRAGLAAQELAAAMGADYVFLPRADATSLSDVVQYHNRKGG